jgi:PPK2 family polyphosphate:nucleotide phosphotransferase
MQIPDLNSFLVKGKIDLKKIPTELDWDIKGKDIEKQMEETSEKLSTMQDTMYAHNRYGVLVILQGMDTCGKDSLVREVFNNFNPRGMVVNSFKTPSANELQHDYLWRHYAALPERGKYAIFNRSHYENVLVTRVNPQYLLNENLPDIEKVQDVTEEFWQRRFKQINNFEKHIVENGTIVFKFFLYMGKDEQRKRLLRRLENKKHNWKFNPGDIKERELWDEYMRCYEEAINHTSTEYAPWHIIPADSKKTARLLVAEIIYEKMKKYTDIQEPDLSPEVEAHFNMYKEKLAAKEL